MPSDILQAMDPRIARTKSAVRRATLELLGSRGYAAFSIEGVAQLAGVAKSTIYRHWPTKLAMIADSLETLNEQPQPDISATTARGQVIQLVDHLVSAFADSVLSACIPALIEAAEHHDEVSEFLHAYSARRRQNLTDTIQRGIDEGELSEAIDAELAALALSGSVIYRRVLSPAPLSGEDGRRAVDLILGPSGRPTTRIADAEGR